MKKDEYKNMEAAQVNIDLNEIMNEDNKITYKKGASSITEVNNAIQDDFYSENSQEEVIPTNINNETPAVIITGKDI